MIKPKILLLDIETAPAKVYSWGLFQQDHGINQVVEDGYMLCWCAKWSPYKMAVASHFAEVKCVAEVTLSREP